jgi:hypothetical protein
MGSGTEGTIPQGFNGEPSHTPGMDLWRDPRTGLYFPNESIARSLGYGQPVNTPDTIVQVGIQGSFTADGRLVTADMLNAAGADYSGYAAAAKANLANTPSSDAESAAGWLSAYVRSPAFVEQFTPDRDTHVTTTSPATTSAVSPTAIPGTLTQYTTATPASAAADQTVNTGGVTLRENLTGYAGLIIAGIVVVIGLIFIMSRGK